MKRFLDLRLNRFVPLGLIALAAAVLLAPAPASATPYVVKVVQKGSNLVATGSGEFDLTGLTYGFQASTPASEIIPSDGYIGLGPVANGDLYVGFSGPATFGSGTGQLSNTTAGDSVVLYAGNYFGLPRGYTSGTALSDSATWDNATFASLGATPGTYVWTWGSAADQSFTLIIGGSGGGTTVPEPAALGMFGFGVLLIGGFVGLRRRIA